MWILNKIKHNTKQNKQNKTRFTEIENKSMVARGECWGRRVEEKGKGEFLKYI